MFILRYLSGLAFPRKEQSLHSGDCL
uniref:Uncharacterized protein n=1 Tax=Arundo donax TaxID=35708 RepID=A0A0A9E3B0_ARUDO